MLHDDIVGKILSNLSEFKAINVQKLRNQVLIQLQTDLDEKSVKKKFKKAVQTLERDGKLILNSDGEISLKKSSKEGKRKNEGGKKEKKKKRSKNIDKDGEELIGSHKKMKSDNLEVSNNTLDETSTLSAKHNECTMKDNESKNKPCPGNPDGYTRLFLGNLPFAVDEASLSTFLSPAVVTHVKWITDKETGKFYGSAFIEMSSSSCGASAVKEKNGEKLMGRPIRINFAPARKGDVWPPISKEVTGNGGQAGGTGVKGMTVKPEGCVKLFVGNLSFEIDDDSLTKFFANVEAEVKAVRFLHHKDSGDFKGCGFVEFWNTEACEKGASLNGKTLLGRPIRIDWSD